MSIYSKKQAQIKAQSGAQVKALLFEKTSTKIMVEYFNYSNIFLAENKAKLLENIRMNKYVFKLENCK